MFGLILNTFSLLALQGKIVKKLYSVSEQGQWQKGRLSHKMGTSFSLHLLFSLTLSCVFLPKAEQTF